MALSKNMKRIGRARQAERADESDARDALEANLKLDLGDAMYELKQIDPHGWERWYDATIPDAADYAQILRIIRARIELLKERNALSGYIESRKASTKALNGDAYRKAMQELGTKPLQWPPTEEHEVDPKHEFPWELKQRKESWQSFLSRMNAPEMVERRGTVLTPYGWRKP